ncbi:HlyD family secretion protein [Vibrio sp. SS-MA-C1-2]|uniref:efflux RND transporter periplasmic adaptor subunit n=1 Tax=Vibrio sp. SS-MA-C1-2 TaxID=2908646 RepID=UPI001F1EE22E|nr:HlyD family secretion protein [Vibrio sp. SS-MA-C1-2]UJF19277.1 HlyD family secretion protein [Vibrio sp. SS-MA-C1-2]
MSLTKFIIPIILVISAIFLGHSIWNTYMSAPWTRDAKVRAEIIQVAPKVSGQIIKINVSDNDFVKKGTIIFEIEATDYENKVKEAEATLVQLEASLAQAKNNYNRDKLLLPKRLISEKQVTNEKLDVDSQQASYNEVLIDLDVAKLNLKRTKIIAPEDGYITNLQQRVGNYINVGQTFVALVEADSYYILGYFTEAKIKKIQQGQSVEIYPYTSDSALSGTVQSVGRAIVDQSSDQTGLLPNVQPTIPWVRLGQRVPVRIAIDKAVVESNRLIAGTTVSLKVQE